MMGVASRFRSIVETTVKARSVMEGVDVRSNLSAVKLIR